MSIILAAMLEGMGMAFLTMGAEDENEDESEDEDEDKGEGEGRESFLAGRKGGEPRIIESCCLSRGGGAGRALEKRERAADLGEEDVSMAGGYYYVSKYVCMYF